jgi:hypothetical protein
VFRRYFREEEDEDPGESEEGMEISAGGYNRYHKCYNRYHKCYNRYHECYNRYHECYNRYHECYNIWMAVLCRRWMTLFTSDRLSACPYSH